MTEKEIFHEILIGLNPYESCGVPTRIYQLAKVLTEIVYGVVGLSLLEKYHIVFDENISFDNIVNLHSIDGWDDNGNTHVGPEELIKKLKALP